MQAAMRVSALVPHRVDLAANVRRFYARSLENSLLGDILLVRRRGRIGTHGRVQFNWFITRATPPMN